MYDLPTTATTKMVYPIVAGVDDAVLQFWLDRVVGKDVDQSWPDYGADAQMAAAVHRYLTAQAGAEGGSGDLAGVTDFRSASFQARFSDDYVKQQIAGGWATTSPGQDYAELLRKFASGPRVTAAGVVPCFGYGYNGFAGPLAPYWP